MKRNVLRAPRGIAEHAADAVRIAGLLSVVVAAIGFAPTDAGVVAFALPGLALPRLLGMRASVDLVCQIALLVAAWSNVVDLYRTVSWWDLIVHGVCTGILAVVAYAVFARAGIVPAPGLHADESSRGVGMRAALPLAIAFGLALSAVWEIIEWAGWRFISREIYVAYQDSIGDMAVGALGSAVAGVVLATVPVLRADAH